MKKFFAGDFSYFMKKEFEAQDTDITRNIQWKIKFPGGKLTEFEKGFISSVSLAIERTPPLCIALHAMFCLLIAFELH